MKSNRYKEKFKLSEEDDFFGTFRKAKKITDIVNKIGDQDSYSDRMISIIGPWGSGKSTVMDYIFNHLDKNKFKAIWFDAWKYEQDDNLSLSLLSSIALESESKFTKKSKEAFNSLVKVLKSFSSGISVSFLGINFSPSDIYDRMEKEFSIPNASKYMSDIWLNDEFNKILPKDKKIVLFLDDLDRCEYDNVLNLLSAIYNIFYKAEKIIIIAGIDKNAIIKALKYRYSKDEEKAEKFLEKIFTMDFNITYENILDKVIKRDFPDHSGVFMNFFLYTKINNPRKIIRIINKYHLFQDIVRTESGELSKTFCNVNEDTVIYHLILLYMINLNLNYQDCLDSFMNPQVKYLSYADLIRYTYSNQEHSLGKAQNFSLDENYCMSDIFNDNASIEFADYTSHQEFMLTNGVLPVIDGYSSSEDKILFMKYIRLYNLMIIFFRFTPQKLSKHTYIRIRNLKSVLLLPESFFNFFNDEIHTKKFSEGEIFMLDFAKFLVSELNHDIDSKRRIIRVTENNTTFQQVINFIADRI